MLTPVTVITYTPEEVLEMLIQFTEIVRDRIARGESIYATKKELCEC